MLKSMVQCSCVGMCTCEEGAWALFPPEQESGKGEGRIPLTQPRDPKMAGEIMYLKFLCKV